MENTRTNVFEFRMAPCGETRSRTRRRRGRDRSHNSLWVSTFHFAVCLSSLNSCCGFCLSFSFSLCFPFLRYPGLQAAASAADLQNPISGFFGFLIGWCIPNPDFCVVQPCRGLFFFRKTALFRKHRFFLIIFNYF